MNQFRKVGRCRPEYYLYWLALIGLSLPSLGQSAGPVTAQTHRYVIEMAGLRVGTMTAVRQPQANDQVTYTLISDVKVNVLVYKVVIYYKVTNVFQHGQLQLSTVEARSNRGNYSSRTEWKKDHYEIVADQYKHRYRAKQTALIEYTVTNLFFEEPAGQSRAYAEYFGDYFTLTPARVGTYRARRDGREDEYRYENGQLTSIIKQNPLKNFVIQLLPQTQSVAANASTSPRVVSH